MTLAEQIQRLLERHARLVEAVDDLELTPEQSMAADRQLEQVDQELAVAFDAWDATEGKP